MQAFASATAGRSFLELNAPPLTRKLPRRLGCSRTGRLTLVPFAVLPPRPALVSRRHVLGLLGGVYLYARHARAAAAARAAAPVQAEPLPLTAYRDTAGAFAVLRPSAWARDEIVSSAAFARASGIGGGPGVAFTYLLDPSENMSVLGRPCGGEGYGLGSGSGGGGGEGVCEDLRALGTAGAFGRQLVRSIAESAPRPLRVASMLAAHERIGHRRGAEVLYYEVEYEVRSPAWVRRNICVAAARDGVLYTLNVQAPLARWQELSSSLHVIADSFELL